MRKLSALMSVFLLIGCSEGGTGSSAPTPSDAPPLPLALGSVGYSRPTEDPTIREEIVLNKDQARMIVRATRKQFEPYFEKTKEGKIQPQKNKDGLLVGYAYEETEKAAYALKAEGEDWLIVSRLSSTCTNVTCRTDLKADSKLDLKGYTEDAGVLASSVPRTLGSFTKVDDVSAFAISAEQPLPPNFALLTASYELTGKYDYSVSLASPAAKPEGYYVRLYYPENGDGPELHAPIWITPETARKFFSRIHNGYLANFQIYQETKGALVPVTVRAEIKMPLFEADPADFKSVVTWDPKTSTLGELYAELKMTVPFESGGEFYELGGFESIPGFISSFSWEFELDANSGLQIARARVSEGTTYDFAVKITAGHRHFVDNIVSLQKFTVPVFNPNFRDVDMKCEPIENGVKVSWTVPNSLAMRLKSKIRNLDDQPELDFVSEWSEGTSFSVTLTDPRATPELIPIMFFPLHLEYKDPNGEIKHVGFMESDFYPVHCGLK